MNIADRLAQLSAAGVSIWLDDLSRERLTSGNLADLIRSSSVVGVTTNPTIFAGALSDGRAYDAQVREFAARGADLQEAVRELTTTDVRDACDLFRHVHEATNGVDGRVSIEVDPRLARDVERTVAEAIDLWKTVDRPNLLVKIPGTEEGLIAIKRALAEGVSVNVTLIFSVARYRQVIDAFMTGLERAKENGHDLADIHSVASFFVSRMDTEVDARLTDIGSPEAKGLLGKAGVANARLAYREYLTAFAADRWRKLAAEGARPQRPLWASTGVKNPDYPDTLYVDELVYAGVVNTMPEQTLHAVADHGAVAAEVTDDPVAVFRQLAQVGVDLDDVFEVLEHEGVGKFEKSWSDLLQTVNSQLVAAHED